MLLQPKCTPMTISKIDQIDLDAAMSSLDFNPILSADDPNIAANLLTNLLAQALVSNTKLLRLPRHTRTIKPCITIGLWRCIRNRDNVHKKLKHFPNDSILSATYRRYWKFCNNIWKKVKREYQRQEILAAGSSIRRLLEVIKTNTNLNKPKDYSISLLIMSSSRSRFVNEVNDYISNIGKSVAEEQQLGKSGRNNTDYFNDNLNNSCAIFDTFESEIKNIL